MKLRTYAALGFGNCVRFAWHKSKLRSGWYQRVGLPGNAYEIGAVFRALEGAASAPPPQAARDPTLARADELLAGSWRYFGRKLRSVEVPPDWLADPWQPEVSPSPPSHWSRVDEFAGGDIKGVWEASRFAWAPLLAQAFRLTGDTKYSRALGDWLDSWIDANPLNIGPNWKCGQETSIRLQNFLLATWLCGLRSEAPLASRRFVVEHLQRIRVGLGYALAQDNNHGTSEAAALLVGGEWLLAHGATGCEARRARLDARLGRRHLTRLIGRLIGADGSFSQYSTNYHRLMLDTLSLAQWWCGTLRAPGFVGRHYERVLAALQWMNAMTDEVSGDAPNIGGNDGADLLAFSGRDYRDFRSSLQLASALFLEERRYPPGPWDDVCRWLEIDLGAMAVVPRPRVSRVFGDGGYVVLASAGTSTWCAIRFPHFRFRPSQADALHVDLWASGNNLTRDAGTFSYNAQEPWLSYFPGTSAHCTCEFDGRDQMPRISRFLFGDWLRATECTFLQRIGESGVSWCGSYRDRWGANHRRTVGVENGKWSVRDEVTGYRERAVIRWRLAPAQWRLEGRRLTSSLGQIGLQWLGEAVRVEICEGWESRYYRERTPLPVLEIEFAAGGAQLDTTIEPYLHA